MRKTVSCLLLLFLFYGVTGQDTSKLLTVEKIMRDPRWIGTSPSNLQWGQDGRLLYFNWNPGNETADSLYHISIGNLVPVKATAAETQEFGGTGTYVYNQNRSACTYSRDGDIFYYDLKTRSSRRITRTVDVEAAPRFSFGDRSVVYVKNQNLYAWEIMTGETWQLTNFRADALSTPGGNRNAGTGTRSTAQEDWLKNDQLRTFQVLKERKEKKEKADAYTRSLPKSKELRVINIDDKTAGAFNISPDGRFITYTLSRWPTNTKSTVIPNYVTETGFTTDIPGRTKVGAPQGSSEFYLYDRDRDTIYLLKTDSLPGIKDLPDYVKDYPAQLEERKKKNENRTVSFTGSAWSPSATKCMIDIRSNDNKDRWLMLWDTATRAMRLIDRQRDEAWIGGPAVAFGRIGWLDNDHIWFLSEVTGYSHIYVYDVRTSTKKALTNGNYEVQQVQLSADKKTFFITTNEVHPGEQHFYRLQVATGKKERITTMTGANQAVVSKDEKWIAYLYSYSNKPWELYLQENKPGSQPIQVTNKAQSEAFKSYPWRDPEIVTIPASDGAVIYGRLYKPAVTHGNHPAILFVHGAGYLQNAHKWWSTYFREYLFHNLLVEKGYTVLDIDYRGSAGYGRDWRTGIYRHMGGKDLSDHVDAVKWLVKTQGVNPGHVGIYGGSYGGFITLMAMFTQPDVFAAGAGLRSVTDWAQYNHPYTSNILNEPYNDSLAYRRSSPLYYAGGLKGHLLMCHGMVDVNVHFQDIVKVTQRLIELGKNDWELAVYPMEDHGFVEPSSWTDEYKRILKLFESVLKKE